MSLIFTITFDSLFFSISIYHKWTHLMLTSPQLLINIRETTVQASSRITSLMQTREETRTYVVSTYRHTYTHRHTQTDYTHAHTYIHTNTYTHKPGFELKCWGAGVWCVCGLWVSLGASWLQVFFYTGTMKQKNCRRRQVRIAEICCWIKVRSSANGRQSVGASSLS